ncbi:MAG: transposase [Gammaproteobacteria bacterium]|nr:transposase [Gammaproteobacteria bacterium]
MARNQVQFQKGLSLPRFLKQYGTEMQCHSSLFHWRWAGGFVCPDWGHTGHCEIRGRSVYQCHRCHRQTSVTSGTIFEYTKLPLTSD